MEISTTTSSPKDFVIQNFYQAVRRGDTASVKEYITKLPALLNTPNAQGDLPLQVALRASKLDNFKLLLEAGATLTPELVQKLLLYIVTFNKIEALKILAAKGVDINNTFFEVGKNNLLNPLMYAIILGKEQLAQWLITELKADVNKIAPNDINITPLYLALSYNNAPIAALLLSYGADSTREKENINITTPLDLALTKKNKAVLITLLSQLSDISKIEEKRPISFLTYTTANTHEDFEAAKLLIQKGAQLSKPDPQGFTPIMHAIKRDNIRLVKLLWFLEAPLSEKERNIATQNLALNSSTMHFLADPKNGLTPEEKTEFNQIYKKRIESLSAPAANISFKAHVPQGFRDIRVEQRHTTSSSTQ